MVPSRSVRGKKEEVYTSRGRCPIQEHRREAAERGSVAGPVADSSTKRELCVLDREHHTFEPDVHNTGGAVLERDTCAVIEMPMRQAQAEIETSVRPNLSPKDTDKVSS